MPDLTQETRAHRDLMVKVRETRSIPFRDVEMREKPNGTGGTTLTFSGYACVTDEGYEMRDMFGPYTEVVRGGAFTKTLSEGADVAFLINHEGMTLARTKSETLTLAEDGTGLLSTADLDPTVPVVQSLRSAIERKDIDEMSFAFMVMRQQWSPDYDQRDIMEVSIDKGDVSAVNYGANPHTGGSVSIRSLLEARGLTMRSLACGLQEVRAGKTLSQASLDVLTNVLSLVSDADDNLDDAQEILADLMGVPNPDDPEPDDESGESEAKARHALNVMRAKGLRSTAA